MDGREAAHKQPVAAVLMDASYFARATVVTERLPVLRK